MSLEVQEAPVEAPQPAENAPRSLYRYATWVHVGPGAEECSEVDEKDGTNRCPDTGHFHAFCRIPNQFQEREIRERAEAARARKIRQLRDNGSDAYEILEGGLEEMLAEPDAAERMANELIGYDWAADYLTAVRQVRDLDDEGPDAAEGTKLYAHVDEDRMRYARLQAEGEEAQDTDEYRELGEHLGRYELVVKEHYDALTNPKRESYLAMAEPDLAELLRQKRIKLRAHQEFMHHYSIHEWLSCTYRHPDGPLCFADLDSLQNASAEVLEALNETFADLERTAQEAQGNS